MRDVSSSESTVKYLKYSIVSSPPRNVKMVLSTVKKSLVTYTTFWNGLLILAYSYIWFKFHLDCPQSPLLVIIIYRWIAITSSLVWAILEIPAISRFLLFWNHPAIEGRNMKISQHALNFAQESNRLNSSFVHFVKLLVFQMNQGTKTGKIYSIVINAASLVDHHWKSTFRSNVKVSFSALLTTGSADICTGRVDGGISDYW